MTSGNRRSMGARQRMVAVVLILAFGITLSFILFQARGRAQASRQDEFRQRATMGATALQRSMQEHLEVLYGLAALYATAAQPLSLNRDAFRELTRGPLKRYPGVQALGWIPRVADAEREAYVAAARKDGPGDFQIVEWTPKMHTVRAARHDMYYPIFYIEPLEQHRAALGFNLGSVPLYLEAMQKGLSTEAAVASAWRSLAQDTGEQLGFLLFVPIYKAGMPHRTFEERRMHLQGFTMAMFRLDTLVEQSLQGLALGTMGLDLSDVTDAASKYLLSLQLEGLTGGIPYLSPASECPVRGHSRRDALGDDLHRGWPPLVHAFPSCARSAKYLCPARLEYPRRRVAVHAFRGRVLYAEMALLTRQSPPSHASVRMPSVLAPGNVTDHAPCLLA